MDNGAGSYRRFLEGDESAFDAIMEELFHSLVFFTDRYVHDLPAAEDIAMDVFADLIVHPRRYNFKVSLKTYLFMRGEQPRAGSSPAAPARGAGGAVPRRDGGGRG